MSLNILNGYRLITVNCNLDPAGRHLPNTKQNILGRALRHGLLLALLLVAGLNTAQAQINTLINESFEPIPAGWTTNPNSNDTATAGFWDIGNPTLTTYQNGTTPSGTNALVTAFANTSNADLDVDGGATSVSSPAFTINTNANSANLSFSYYFRDSQDDGVTDNNGNNRFSVSAVNTINGQVTKLLGITLSSSGATPPAYAPINLDLSRFAGRTLRILFSANGSSGGFVEASVDDFVITEDITPNLQATVSLVNNADGDSFFTDFEFAAAGAATIQMEATINNTSAVDALTLTSLSDTSAGNVLLSACDVNPIPALGTAVCSYARNETLVAGQSIINTLTVTGNQGAAALRTISDQTTYASFNAVAGPAINDVFYVPYPEDQVLTALDTLYNPAICSGTSASPSDPITTVIGLTILSANTVIYYDHRGDGFEPILENPVQSTTLVWGDGDLSNGIAPGFPSDIIPAGSAIELRNDVVSTTRDSVVDFDGGDKIASSFPIAMTRAAWADGSEALLAGALEMYNTKEQWGTSYVFPVGQNLPNAAGTLNDGRDEIFEYVGASIAAQKDGTVVNVDANNDGDFLDANDINGVVINEGQSLNVNGGILLGGTATASEDVRIDMITGDICANYEARFFTLFPRDDWSNNYYNPVTSTGANADSVVTVYNPQAVSLTISVETADGAGGVNSATFTVAAGAAADFTMPTTSGARFFTDPANNGGASLNFYAVVAVDQDDSPAGSLANDWGITLVPQQFLSTQILVGTGIGRDPNSTVNPAENGSPIWITAAKSGSNTANSGIDVCVDFNGDGDQTADGGAEPDIDPNTSREYDIQLNLEVFESAKVFDPDGDQTGMLLFICDTNDDAALSDQREGVLSAAWGQDPATASVGEPGLDAGTVVPNLRSILVSKRSAITADLNADGMANVGDIITFQIDVTNVGLLPVDTLGITLEDSLPVQFLQYILNSTTFDDGINPIVAIADDLVPPNLTEFPLDVDATPFQVPSQIAIGQTVTFLFQTTVINVPFAPDEVCNTASGTLSDDTDSDEECNPVSLNTSLISGAVTEDTDGDGIGDAPIEGATVLLYSDPLGTGNPADGTIQRTVQTAADGSYQFIDLQAGNYIVVEVDPATYSSVLDADQDNANDTDVIANLNSNDNIIPVSVAQGGEVNSPVVPESRDIGNNFVDRRIASISGVVWLDEDQDGINDIEEGGLTNIVVELRNGICTPLPSVAADCPTVLTDQFGNYSFNGLPAGNYDVVVDPTTLPAAVTNTAGPFGLPLRTVALIAGQNVADQDFGYIANADTGIIGDRVWSDANGDGIQDPGEAGINNVSMELLDSTGAVIATTTTAADGDYLFTNVPFGNDYVVRVVSTDPDIAGFTPTVGPQSEGGFTSNPVSLNASLTTVTDVDFGFDNVNTLDINDRVWFDEDGDGVADAGEPGIAGVTVDLLNSSGNIVATTTTDANGDFSFTGVPDGLNYQLQVSDRGNELNGLNETTGTGGTATITGLLSVAAGGDGVLDTIGDDGTDTFGYNNAGLIAGVVYSDPDSSASQDPNEPGLAGVTVTLQNGTGGVIATTTTNPDGSYMFDALPPGDYVVIVTQPGGTTQTEDPDATVDNQTPITLGVGQSSVGNDFGYLVPGVNNIFGTVFLDTDKDGFEDVGEVGIPNVTLDLVVAAEVVIDSLIDINGDGAVDLTDDGFYLGYEIIDGRIDLNGDGAISGLDDGAINGVTVIDGELDVDNNGATGDPTDDATLPAAVIATTTTDALGNYAFEGLPNGDYSVAVTDSTGQLAGYDITSGLDVLAVTLAGADVNNVDFGYIKEEATGSISGEVFLDEDGDGIADATETNFGGVDVYLCSNPVAAEPCDPGDPEFITQTVTDANGEYSFNGLPAGSYLVDVDPTDVPAALTNTVNPGPVALSEGEKIEDVDFGYVPTVGNGLLTGLVWTDTNADGVVNSGEAPIAGVTINILDPNSATPLVPIGSAVTLADGTWSFAVSGPTLVDDLIVQYVAAGIPANLNSAQPTNLAAGITQYDGDNVDILSDADRLITDLNFGFQPLVAGSLGSISGTIYSDTDQNGVYAPAIDGEFESITINLLDSVGNVIASTITDENGFYSFNGLQDDAVGYSVVVTDLGNDLQDVNVNETITNPIPIVGGANVANVNQGYISNPTGTLGSIGNMIFVDSNMNGFADEGEPPVVGVTVQCWVDNDRSATVADPFVAVPAGDPQAGVDNLVRTVTTDANGEYYCTNLPAGQYIAVVTDTAGVLTGFTDTSVNNAANNVGDNFAKPFSYAIAVAAGIPSLTADFGVEGNATISGTVYFDDDADGDYIVPPGSTDVPQDAVKVQACNATGLCINVFTMPDGSYTIPVGPGDWTVTVLTPPVGTDPLEVPAVNPITVVANDAITEVDFGFIDKSSDPRGNISGTLLEDTSGDGLGDTPIVGAIIQLYTDPNGDGNPADGTLVATALTNATGDYLFANQPASNTNYVVMEIDPANYVSISDAQSVDGDVVDNTVTGTNDNLIAVTLGTNENDVDNDFVDLLPGTISGTVWLDEDLDGINDIEEASLTGIIVELLNSGGMVIATTVTDASGNYSFPGLVAGDYTVNVVDTSVPAGLSLTAGPFGIDPRPVTVLPGEVVEDQDFGYVSDPGVGAIGDRVWSDADSDGIQDPGEAGVAGVTLTLTDGTGANIGTTTTDENGNYLFTNVPFGDDYVISISPLDAAIVNAPGAPYTPTMGPQSEGGFVGHPVSLNAALTTVSDVDFGFNSLTSNNTIIDTAWFDENGDGVFDATEAPIPGVTVNLYNDANFDGIPDDDDGDGQPDVVATATTDANGDVTFTGLPNGNYVLGVTDNGSVLNSLTGTTPGALSSSSAQIPVAGGASVNGDSFGYNNPGLISGTVYNDVNNDSNKTPEEAGIATVEVTLLQDTDNNGSFETTVTSVFTNPDGSYAFDGLPPGAYQVVVSPPAGTQSEDPDGTADDVTNISLAIGESSVENDFGYNNPSLNDISGTVFNDTDKDGVEDAGETGIAGVTIDLIAPQETVIDGGLDINQDGVIDATDDGIYLGVPVIDGQLDINRDGSIDATDDGSVNGVAVIDGQLDTNGDGAITPADDAILPSAVLASTITDALGNYSFEDLPNGDYEVSVTDLDSVLAGYDITSGLDTLPVTLIGLPVTDVDFGYVRDEATGSISGEVFVDEDGDGVADDEETNLSGIRVYLCTSPLVSPPCDPTDPEFVTQSTTDVNGEYVFKGLPADQYVVDTDPTDVPLGLILSVDPDPISLSEGEEVTGVDVGYVPAPLTGIMSGVAWVDVDNDGNFDPGEAPIAGLTISVRDFTGLELFTTDTALDGSWIISNIAVPNVNSPNDLGVIYDPADVPAGLNNLQPSNMPLGDNLYLNQDLAADPDRNISYLDFGFPPNVGTDLGSIAGTIYSDADNSGGYSAPVDGELAGVTLNLLDSGGNVIATTTTDANGNYSFVGLPDGDYSVVVTDLANILGELNPNEIITNPISIVAGADIAGQNAGYVSDTRLGSIGNRFWFDTNRDGIMQDSEPGIPGVTVQCWLDSDRSETPDNPLIPTGAPQPGVDNLIRTVVTDEAGEYYCTSLPTGQYIVRVFNAVGFVEATDGTMVTGSAADSNAKPWIYALTTTSPNLTGDFGVSGTNAIAGSVFIEDEMATADAMFDGNNDGPAAGVPVILLLQQPDGSYAQVQSTTTAPDGSYSFIGLPNGNYRVQVLPNGSVVSGYGQTADPDLAAGTVCTSATAAQCDDAFNAALNGTPVAGINFGYQKGFTTTPVTVNYFTAISIGGGIEFNWETTNEVGHLGYQIYARGADGWNLITEELIVSDGGGAMDVRQYSFIGYNIDANWFALVDVSAAEELTPHGPYRLDQAYGGVLEVPAEFDWSGIDVSAEPDKSEIENSVLHRLQNSIEPDERAERQ